MIDIAIGVALVLIFLAYLKFSDTFAKMYAQDRAAVDAQKTGTDEENTRISLHYLPERVHEIYFDHYYMYKRK